MDWSCINREVNEEGLVYEVDGNIGKTLKVYEDKVAIVANVGVKSLLLGNALHGNKEFYYSDLTSVQFKNIGITTGYLQFEYAGSRSISNFQSENSFTFSASIGTQKYDNLKKEMPSVYEDIQRRVREAKNVTKTAPVIQQASAADEIIKFKQLLDAGVISQEEFDKKKAELLGL